MAPTTRRQAAKLQANDNPGPNASSASDRSPPDLPSVAKAKKPRKDTKTSATKASTKTSARVTKSKTPSNKTRRAIVKPNAGADPRIGMKGFLPNGLPDTGNELFIPGHRSIACMKQTELGSADVDSAKENDEPEKLPENSILKETEAMNVEAAAKEPDRSALTSNDETNSAQKDNAQDQVDLGNTYGFIDDSPVQERKYPRTHKVRYDRNTPASYPLEVSGVSMPTLTNDIHDIWDRARHDHWNFDSQLSHNQDWRIYEILVPAQRLASLWLTRPEYEQFWTTLLYAPFEADEKRNTWNIDNKAVDLPDNHPIDLEKRLRYIAKKIHFRFAPLECAKGNWAFSEAISRRNSDSWKGESLEPGYVTVLHDDFMFIPWPNADPPVWKEASTCAKLRFLFLLAIKLGGQLAEVLWMDRCLKEQGDDGAARRQGLTIGKSKYHGMSHAFECWVLGGRLQVVDNWPDPLCPDGLAVTSIDYVSAYAEVKMLAMKGIHKQFSSTSWASADRGQSVMEGADGR
ncbi:MAG: hypothetical protein Q9208_008801 [Pyrenodesmia sp. 3 TL-2023]